MADGVHAGLIYLGKLLLKNTSGCVNTFALPLRSVNKNLKSQQTGPSKEDAENKINAPIFYLYMCLCNIVLYD